MESGQKGGLSGARKAGGVGPENFSRFMAGKGDLKGNGVVSSILTSVLR